MSLNASYRDKFRDALVDVGIGLEDCLTDKIASLLGEQSQALNLIMVTILC